MISFEYDSNPNNDTLEKRIIERVFGNFIFWKNLNIVKITKNSYVIFLSRIKIKQGKNWSNNKAVYLSFVNKF